MRQQELTLDNGQILIVKAVPLGKYPELLEKLKALPSVLSDLDKMKEAEILSNLPNILSKSITDVKVILQVATDLSAEKVDELVMPDVVSIVMAIWEVNSYGDIFSKIKKAMTRQAPQTPQASTSLPSNGDGGQ